MDVLAQETIDRSQPHQRPGDQPGHLEGAELRENVILVMGKTPPQPRIRAAIAHVGDESGRGITPRSQVVRQCGMARVEWSQPAGGEVVRPSPREETRVRGQGPGRGRPGPIEANPAVGQLHRASGWWDDRSRRGSSEAATVSSTIRSRFGEPGAGRGREPGATPRGDRLAQTEAASSRNRAIRSGKLSSTPRRKPEGRRSRKGTRRAAIPRTRRTRGSVDPWEKPPRPAGAGPMRTTAAPPANSHDGQPRTRTKDHAERKEDERFVTGISQTKWRLIP